MTTSEQSVMLVNNFITEGSDSSMQNLVNHVKLYDLEDSTIALLANKLANSGLTIPNRTNEELFDIPSTGGPSSLSTLLCPLLLALQGNKVLKLGIPGRPAGGIDVLSQIKGYNINPSISEIEKWIKEGKYVHFLANEKFTPLDAKLFQFRKRNNVINIPPLVIASLLSKKIAVELNCVGLDVRVSQFGNFGSTANEARKNAQRFNRIAQLVGIKSKCFITNGMYPQQPYIGRGEALVALNKIFEMHDNGHLRSHLGSCIKMTQAISEKSWIDFTAKDIKSTFFANIELQGGDEKSFYKIVSHIEEGHLYSVYATKSGFLSINMYEIRNTIVKIQNDSKMSFFSDPCGIILKKMSNEYIDKGEVICSYRCNNEFVELFGKHLESSFEIIDVSILLTDLEIIN
jgi:thymidine phosphorylase